MTAPIPFWETTPLDQLSDEQWESLCDGCGRCCLQKLEDVDSGDVFFTRVSCKLLNCDDSRCKDYDQRFTHVPDCTQVRPLTDEKRKWLPSTCAYRLIDEGHPLHSWHPLISGRPESVHEAGISVGSFAVSEDDIAFEHYEEHIIHFPEDS
ncbi:MAG: YcgN family cysteine cluster protein [Granulosicoccus sp.]|nr:YcgN family cysteine cluster protein [Granulosicoccus sp.]